MPRKTEEKEIDGFTYQVRQVGAETGDGILFRLGRGIAMSDLKQEDFSYVRDVFKNSAKMQIVDTKGDGRKTWVDLGDKYDEHFAGRYQAAAEFLKFAFECNFGSFFEAARNVLGSQAALSSVVQRAVGGGSGDSSSTKDSASEASPS